MALFSKCLGAGSTGALRGAAAVCQLLVQAGSQLIIAPPLPLLFFPHSPPLPKIHDQQHPHQTCGEFMSQCFGQFDHILTSGSYDGITHHPDTHSNSCHLFGPSCRSAKAPSPKCIPNQQDVLLKKHPWIRLQIQVS
jgi:hypothetical protein